MTDGIDWYQSVHGRGGSEGAREEGREREERNWKEKCYAYVGTPPSPPPPPLSSLATRDSGNFFFSEFFFHVFRL